MAYPQDERGKITAKGGATERIHRQSGTTRLLTSPLSPPEDIENIEDIKAPDS
ncbi:hypothetical protein [Streptomyces sp. 4F14]|uniref:hypothetical protein n=1 Tax=Streptomyces sp. 4F14 TaxID=3394380 RepID=UPI003A87D31F